MEANAVAAAIMQYIELFRPGEPMTVQELTTIVSLWNVKETTSRKNVHPEGKVTVRSQIFGLLRTQCGQTMIERECLTYRDFTRAVNYFYSSNLPKTQTANLETVDVDPACTAFCINKGFSAIRHRGTANVGPSWVVWAWRI